MATAPGKARMTAFADQLVIRPAVEDDTALILDSWLRSYADSPFARRIPRDLYRSRYGHQGLVKDLLASGLTTCLVLPDDESYVVAWSCADEGALHYVWTRLLFRRRGCCRRLLGAQPLPVVRVTHHTLSWRDVAAGMGLAAEFVNPYA